MPARADRRVGRREHRRVRDGRRVARRPIRERIEASGSTRPASSCSSGPRTPWPQLVEEDPPEALVNSELRSRAEDARERLQAQGVTLEQYLAMHRPGPGRARRGAEGAPPTTAVKVDLALRAVADAEEHRGRRRRPGGRVRAHRRARQPEAQPGAQGLRAQRRRARAAWRAPQAQGARVAAASTSRSSTPRASRIDRGCCSCPTTTRSPRRRRPRRTTTTTTTTTITTATTTTTTARPRP